MRFDQGEAAPSEPELTIVGDVSAAPPGPDAAAPELAVVGPDQPAEPDQAPRVIVAVEEDAQRVEVRPARTGVARVARVLVVCSDAVAVAAAMSTAYAMLPSLYLDAPGSAGAAYRRLGMVTLPLWLMVFRRYRLYNARHVTGRRDEVVRVVHAIGVSTLATALVAYFLDLGVERGWFLMLFAAASAAVLAERELVRYGFSVLRRRGHCLRRVALAGTGPEALALARAFEERPELGYAVTALVGQPDRVEPELAGRYPVLEMKPKLVEKLRLAGATGVLVATTDVSLDLSNRLIRTLTDAGIHVELSSSLRDIDATRLSVRPLGRFPVLYVEPVKRDGWRPVAKRAFDLVVSLIGLLACLPLLALAALAVKLTSPGPVLFCQERVGRGGKTFKLYKLRTMVKDAEALLRRLELENEADGPLFKIRRDPRVTPVGRVLRRLSVDEIPQLVNVIKGEMSLVGPRPALPSEVTSWSPELRERLRVQPGITGMWQVNGRSNASFADYQRWDLYYVDNWSVWRDLAIMFKTIPAVVCAKGAC